MTSNQVFLRNLIGVATGIAVVTAVGLWFGQHGGPARHAEVAAAQVIARPVTPEALGATLYTQKGCVVCHSIDGTPRVGPSFLHDYGTTIALADGSMVVMNDAYIRESLLEPRAKARPGYPPTMPSFDGLLKDREIDALAAYIRSLR